MKGMSFCTQQNIDFNEHTHLVVNSPLLQSSRDTVLSNEPVESSQPSTGCQRTLCTLSLWCVKVCEQEWVVTSQILTVLSAEPLARAWRYCLFHDKAITASAWLSATSWGPLLFFIFFFDFPLDAASLTPPRTAEGSRGSRTSRFQISMAGLRYRKRWVKGTILHRREGNTPLV